MLARGRPRAASALLPGSRGGSIGPRLPGIPGAEPCKDAESCCLGGRTVNWCCPLRTEQATGSVLPVLSSTDDHIYLAYRDRHPVDKGRGNRAYVARSPIDDGIHFDTLCIIDKEDMDAESLERPALDVTPDGDWDLYLSCATFNSKHWRIERLRAGHPHDFPARTRTTIFLAARHSASKTRCWFVVKICVYGQRCIL